MTGSETARMRAIEDAAAKEAPVHRGRFFPSHTETFRIFDNDCDMNHLLTPRGGMRLAQQMATDHCTSAGMDADFYERTRTAWVVVRSALAWTRVPHADEELTITTRPEAHRRGMCKRITEFRDARGDEIGLMDARWVLVNTEDRSIYRHLPESYGWVAFNESIDRELRVRIPRKLEGTYVRSVHAGFSYCDANGHVNNTRYADLICDALPDDAMRDATLKSLAISFEHEIPYGSDFDLTRLRLEDGSWYVSGDQNGAHCFEGIATLAPCTAYA